MSESATESETEKTLCQKTPGQIAYEQDCAVRPKHHTGEPRKSWDKLSSEAKWSWERHIALES